MTPLPGGHEILVVPSSVFNTIYLVISPMPIRGEEDVKRNNSFSLHDLCDHALAQKPLPRGS